MSVLPISVPTKKLAAPITSTATSFTVNNILGWDALALTASQFGTLAYVVFRDSTNTLMEIVEIDATTIASDSITITKRGLDFGGGTTTVPANQLAWPAFDTFVDFGSHPAQLFTQGFMDMWNNQTVPLGVVKTFITSPVVPTPTGNKDAAPKDYVDSIGSAGASDGNDTTKGIYERATQAELENNTSAGTTTAPLAVTSGRYSARLYVGYAADAGANDTYVATYAPAPTQWLTGMFFLLKCNTINTGAATFNPNGLGAKTIKKMISTGKVDLDNGDIAAGQTIMLEYDGTDVVLMSVPARAYVSQAGTELFAIATGGDTYAVTITPTYVGLQIGQVIRFKADAANTGAATLNPNASGAKSILRPDGSALADGDIAVGQIVEVAYDGTNLLMLSPVANGPKYKNGETTKNAADASAVQNIAHGLGRAPRYVKITALFGGLASGGAVSNLTAIAVYNGTTQSSVSIYQDNTNATAANTFTLNNQNGGGLGNYHTDGVITVDATNIIITWTKTGSPTGTYNIVWEAQA